MTLTKRQQEVLSFIGNYQKRRGMPPTVREIAEHIGSVSTNGAVCHLKALLKKGAIIHDGGSLSRTWRLPVEKKPKVCPHCGGRL